MLILGHRGARAHAPENTVTALRAALAAGAQGSEFDVRLTTDRVCVCTHDAIVTVDGKARRVCDLSLEQVRRLLIDGPAGGRDRVPTLGEALDALAGAVMLAEIKNHPWDPCYDPGFTIAAAAAELLPAGAIVGCFDPATLGAVRSARPDLRTAVITGAAFDPQANLDAALDGGHEICSVEHAVLGADFVDRTHSYGKLVYAWATDEPAEVRRLAAIGVDALMCDDPGRAIAALRA